MFRTVTTTMLALGALTAAGCSTDRPLLGEDRDQLTVAQCTFFAEGDKVQICHRTGSARNPYNVIRTNIASCGGHSGHVGDYITSSNPADPEYDPTCSGQGCFPEGAPFDNTVECCAGLSPQGGVCRDINECATNNGGCSAGFSCANAPVSGNAPICTPPAAVCGDGIVTAGEQCDDGNLVNGDACDSNCTLTGCGNGIVTDGEQCDDGNLVNGDACSTSCTIERCAILPPPAGDTGLIGRWTFDDLTDTTGNFGPLVLQGSATIAGGMLDVNAVPDGSGALATGWAHSGPYTGAATIREKTLVSWVSLDDVDIRSGSALTLDSVSDADNFDGIVYAERVARDWMNGSNDHLRTQDVAPQADTPANQLVQMAISYRDLGAGAVEITICRDGVELGRYTDGPMAQWLTGNAEVIFGQRHTFPGLGARGGMDAHIAEARIYNTALACGQVCTVP